MEAETLRLQEIIRDIVERRISFNALLGIEVTSFDTQCPRLAFDMRSDLVGHYGMGRLHGGVIAAVLDAVAGFAVTMAITEKYASESVEQIMARIARLGTIDLRVDYLNPGLGKGFTADATVTRLGGRLASAQMSLHNDAGVLIATGAAAYVVS